MLLPCPGQCGMDQEIGPRLGNGPGEATGIGGVEEEGRQEDIPEHSHV